MRRPGYPSGIGHRLAPRGRLARLECETAHGLGGVESLAAQEMDQLRRDVSPS